jgi:hypothetical protein
MLDDDDEGGGGGGDGEDDADGGGGEVKVTQFLMLLFTHSVKFLSFFEPEVSLLCS